MDMFRTSALALKNLDDDAIQLIIRECPSEWLVNFLWYLKDADLIKQVLHNMTRRAAQMVLDDLNRSWCGRNPDTASEADANIGRAAIAVIMALVRRLVDEGKMADVFGRDDAPNFLTDAEVDALLEGVSQHAE